MPKYRLTELLAWLCRLLILFYACQRQGQDCVCSCRAESFRIQCLKYILTMPVFNLPSFWNDCHWTMLSPLSFTLPLAPPPPSPHLILLSSLDVMRLWNRWHKNSKWHRRDGDQTVVCVCEREKQRKILKVCLCSTKKKRQHTKY